MLMLAGAAIAADATPRLQRRIAAVRRSGKQPPKMPHSQKW
jgi:hypothetical protein